MTTNTPQEEKFSTFEFFRELKYQKELQPNIFDADDEIQYKIYLFCRVVTLLPLFTGFFNKNTFTYVLELPSEMLGSFFDLIKESIEELEDNLDTTTSTMEMEENVYLFFRVLTVIPLFTAFLEEGYIKDLSNLPSDILGFVVTTIITILALCCAMIWAICTYPNDITEYHPPINSHP